MSDIRRGIKYAVLRFWCGIVGHRFETWENHVVCGRCNWCGGDAGSGHHAT